MASLKELINTLQTDWKDILNTIINNDESNILDKIIELEENIYPDNCNIFNAFNQFNVDNLKIVIIG